MVASHNTAATRNRAEVLGRLTIAGGRGRDCLDTGLGTEPGSRWNRFLGQVRLLAIDEILDPS